MLSIASYCCLVTKFGLSLQPRALQPVRLPSPSLSPRVCSNSCPLSLWGYLTISSSATLFSWLQSFPASGSFPMSWLFTSGDQSIGASASASVLPVNIQSLFPFRIDWFDLLQDQGTLKSLLQHRSSKTSNFHIHTWLLEKPYLWLWRPLSLLFNMLSRFVIAFFPRSKCLLILWLQSPSAVILEPPKWNLLLLPLLPIYLPWNDWRGCYDIIDRFFLCWILSQLFQSSLLPSSRNSLSSSSLSAIRVVSCTYLRFWYFSWQSWFQLVIHLAQHFTWCTLHIRASLVAQSVKNLPAMQEMQVRSLVGKIPCRRAWQPTPVFLPREFHG